MITLHGNPISGNSHRVTALLSLLGLDYINNVVKLSKGEHKHADFLKLNPIGSVPVLTDEDVVLRDSTAILVYLAKKYDTSKQWLPDNAETQGAIQQWLSIAVNEIASGPAMLRAISVFSMDRDNADAIASTTKLFQDVFEPHLAQHDWLVGSSPTIADVACYGYIARVIEGEFSLTPYPAITKWLARVEAINNFPAMGDAKDLIKLA